MNRERLPWSRFRSVHRDRHGLLLSPFGGSHPLENFRGTFLPLPARERDLALVFIREKLT